MTARRASIFGPENPSDELDVSGFTPKAGPDTADPPAAEVRAVAEAANFRSREAAPPVTTKRAPRRHRTGRNVQFNVKVSQEVIDTFYAISDRQGWVLGETLEHALTALEQELARDGKGRAK
jgi:hypothetical protein